MKKPILALWLLALFGCTQPLPNHNPNGEEELFASMRSEVDSLKGQSKDKWISGSGSHEEIKSLEQLQALIQPISFTDVERAQLLTDFGRARSTMHFGFDGNFHALVFFDSSGVPIREEKW